jgi:hypothetical protein
MWKIILRAQRESASEVEGNISRGERDEVETDSRRRV